MTVYPQIPGESFVAAAAILDQGCFRRAYDSDSCTTKGHAQTNAGMVSQPASQEQNALRRNGHVSAVLSLGEELQLREFKKSSSTERTKWHFHWCSGCWLHHVRKFVCDVSASRGTSPKRHRSKRAPQGAAAQRCGHGCTQHIAETRRRSRPKQIRTTAATSRRPYHPYLVRHISYALIEVEVDHVSVP